MTKTWENTFCPQCGGEFQWFGNSLDGGYAVYEPETDDYHVVCRSGHETNLGELFGLDNP